MTKKKIKINHPKTIFDKKKISEQEFIVALENISKKLIYKFKFGYHEAEDMKQQAAIFAMEGLENYDSSRPLENFLWTHVRNRLFNFKRDNYFRPDNVCAKCPLFDPEMKFSTNKCKKFVNKNECEIYASAENRNSIKKNIMKPCSIEYDQESTDDLSSFIGNEELIKLIESKISTKYRETFLRLKGGSKVNKQEVLKLREHILSLINIEVDNDNSI
jgi:hypothetical protein